MKATAYIGHLTASTDGLVELLTDESALISLDYWIERLQALRKLYALNRTDDTVHIAQVQSEFYALTRAATGAAKRTPLTIIQPVSVLSILQGKDGQLNIGSIQLELQYRWLEPKATLEAMERDGHSQRAQQAAEWFEACQRAGEHYLK